MNPTVIYHCYCFRHWTQCKIEAGLCCNFLKKQQHVYARVAFKDLVASSGSTFKRCVHSGSQNTHVNETRVQETLWLILNSPLRGHEPRMLCKWTQEELRLAVRAFWPPAGPAVKWFHSLLQLVWCLRRGACRLRNICVCLTYQY